MLGGIEKNIRELAYNTAKEHLTSGQDMNEYIYNLYVAGDKIENNEILKRVCELANNNVYIALFKNPKTDRSNITFTLADAKGIIEKMNNKTVSPSKTVDFDYISAPVKKLNVKVASFEIEKTASEFDASLKKIATVHKLERGMSCLVNMVSGLECVKTASENRMYDIIGRLSEIGAGITSNRESLGDMTKIAMKSVKDNYGKEGVEKIAKVCDYVMREVKARGFNISTDITKLSSSNIDVDGELYKLSNEFNLETEKIAACKKIITGAGCRIELIKKATRS